MQIRTRLTIQFTYMVVFILAVAFFSVYVVDKNHTEEEFFRRLRNKAFTSAALLLKVKNVDSTLLKTIDLSNQDVLYRENISILNRDGRTVYSNSDTLDFVIPPNVFEEVMAGEEQRLMLGKHSVVGVPFREKGNQYAVFAGAIDVGGEEQLSYLFQLLIGFFLFMTAVVSFVGWFFANRALRPIQKVMHEVQQLSSANLSQRVHGEEKPDEIGTLVGIINRLLERVEKAFMIQKTFVANVSHELKNPLTSITSQLEVTLLKERSSEEYRQAVQSVLDDIRGLNQLSHSLLELASVSQDQHSFSMSPTRVDDILWEVRESLQFMNSSFTIKINTLAMPENEEDLMLMANPYLLKTAFQNIAENACKYSSDHSATIELRTSKSEMVVCIKDTGLGIAASELDNIFQPFYRTNTTSKVKGYGIGLSLSQRIISIHNGVIQVKSILNLGTEVSVIFKR